MANFGNGNQINPNAYHNSFMGLADGTVYSDPTGAYGRIGMKSNLQPQLWDKFDQAMQVKLKSTTTTTGGTGLTDNVLIPISHDNKVVDLTRKQTPAVSIIPRVSNMGIVAPYKTITSKGAAGFALENAAIAVNDFTPDVSSVNMKYMYARGSVSGPVNQAAPGHTLSGFQPTGGATGSFTDQSASNMDQFNILIQAAAMRELEEDTIFNGDASTDAREYSGIIKLMGVTNTVDKNTSALDLKDYNTCAQYAFDDGGLPTVAFCDTATFNDTLNLLAAKQGFFQGASMTEYGFTSVKLNVGHGQIDLIQSRFLSTTTGSKSVYMLDLSVWEMRVLLDMTFERLAKTRDSNEFMLKQYEALLCRAPQFNGSITEIA
jgi:hypothetical protein